MCHCRVFCTFMVIISVLHQHMYWSCHAFETTLPYHSYVRQPKYSQLRTTLFLRRVTDETSPGRRFGMTDKSSQVNDVRTYTIDRKANSGDNSERESLPSTTSIWERMALYFVTIQFNLSYPNSTTLEEDRRQQFVSSIATTPEQLYDYAQYISVFRVMIPSFGYATIAKLIYPFLAMWVVSLINGDSGIFAVVSQDASQYIQNICTTSGLVFSILIGQTYYFMYQQQEKIYYAIYNEVAMAKLLLEQISLISRGRTQLYETILQQMNRYVQDDLQHMSDIDPATLLSSRPCDDPLEDILYLTSVGEPSQIYQSIRSLRQARAQRLASLQMKLPEIQMTLLWILAAIALLVFPLLGAGSQTIGGFAILQVQSWYISFLVFGISLVMGIIYELRSPNQAGAYNAQMVLTVMISGLQEELQERLQHPTSFASLTDDLPVNGVNYNPDDSPSIDSDEAVILNL
jgi:hypothetical protein